MGRILSIDYGEKRIGIALSDELKITAQPFDTILNTGIKKTIERIADIITKKDVEKIVLGMPRNLKGKFGKQARIIEDFKTGLAGRISIPIEYQDEWLTSVEAKKTLIKGGVKTGKNKGKIDQISALILLQTHLDSIS